MIPINLGYITFIIFFVPLLLLLLWNLLRAIRHFYKKYFKKESLEGSLLLELKYFLGIVLLLFIIFQWFSSLTSPYYSHKQMRLDKPLSIKGIEFPVNSVGKFSKNEKGMEFSKVYFPSAYDFHDIDIYYINETYTDFLEVTLATSQKINGISCDISKKIELDYDGILMNCTLDENNIFSGVVLPKGLQIKHYRADVNYMYSMSKNEKEEIPTYEWEIDTHDNHIMNKIKYWDIHFELSDTLKILKFKGDVATEYFEDKEIRELMEKSDIYFKSHDKTREIKR